MTVYTLCMLRLSASTSSATGIGSDRELTSDQGTSDPHSAEAFEFKTEFKTTFRATPARYGTFEKRPRIKELPES
jgi:hypothetical protein